MDIEKTIDQKITTAVKKVPKKLEQQILVIQSNSEEQNNRTDCKILHAYIVNFNLPLRDSNL